MGHITDVDENCGIFGCLFNYFYRLTIEADGAKQPAMLILIRIIQFVRQHPRCNADEVHDFLRMIGYDVSKQVADFCLYVIIRSELIKWDASRGAKTIRDVPLYLTTTGRIAINKLLLSITYVSEAMLSSVQIDRGLTDWLRARVPDNALWVADCIANASIALHVIHEIETIETKFAKDNGVDFTPYLLYARLHESLSQEARTITRHSLSKTRTRWAENIGRLRALPEQYPGLMLLGLKQ